MSPSRSLAALGMSMLGICMAPAACTAGALQERSPDFSYQTGYAGHVYTFYIDTGLENPGVVAGRPFSLRYAAEPRFAVPMRLPHTDDTAISEPTGFVFELWEGAAFDAEATRLSTHMLGDALTGTVPIVLPRAGPYFAVLYRPDRSPQEAASALEAYLRSPEDSGYPPMLPSHAGIVLVAEEPERKGSSVLFLPGIKASRLYSGDGTKLWEPFGNHDVEALMHKDDGTSKNAAIHVREGDIVATPPGGADIYRSFGTFMDSLTREGHISAWYAAAYDWRLALPDIARGGRAEDGRVFFGEHSAEPYLLARLRELAAGSGTGKVSLIAHSNGGLVAKELLRALGDEEAARIVDRVVLAGVPQTGAPQALASLLYGYKEGLPWWFPGIVSTATARAYAQNAPMAYHLLPSSAYFAHTDDALRRLISFGAGGAYDVERAAYGSHVDSFDELAAFALAAEGGRTKPARTRIDQAEVVNAKLIDYARAVHETQAAWRAPAGVSMYEIGGNGVPTLSGIEYYERCIVSLCASLYRPAFTSEGDGVVPLASALNYHRDAYGALTLEGTSHGTLLSAPAVQERLRAIFSDATPTLQSDYARATRTDSTPRTFRIFLHSPLALSLVDAYGNRTGSAQGEDAQTKIPGSAYGTLGEMQYLLAPAGVPYQLELEAYASGTFTLEIEERFGEDVTASAAFVLVPVATTTRATLALGAPLGGSGPLAVDRDGDREIDTYLPFVLDSVSEESAEREDGTRRRSVRISAHQASDTSLAFLQLKLYALLLEQLLEMLGTAHMSK